MQYDRTEVSKLQNMMQTLREELAAAKAALQVANVRIDVQGIVISERDYALIRAEKAESLLAKCREALRKAQYWMFYTEHGDADGYEPEGFEQFNRDREQVREALALIDGGKEGI